MHWNPPISGSVSVKAIDALGRGFEPLRVITPARGCTRVKQLRALGFVQAQRCRQATGGGRVRVTADAPLEIGDAALAEVGALGELLLREAGRQAKALQERAERVASSHGAQRTERAPIVHDRKRRDGAALDLPRRW
jgi:hypothetical protein